MLLSCRFACHGGATYLSVSCDRRGLVAIPVLGSQGVPHLAITQEDNQPWLMADSSPSACKLLTCCCLAGLHAMVALDAGAHHVTAVDRWLYLSLACKESLITNGFKEDRFTVVYKRPTDLSLRKDVPILCNLLLCDMMDEGKPLRYPPSALTAVDLQQDMWSTVIIRSQHCLSVTYYSLFVASVTLSNMFNS